MPKKIKQEAISDFFRKNEDGNTVYHPWGYPGEGFLINSAQERGIILFLWAYFLSAPFLSIVIDLTFSGNFLYMVAYPTYFVCLPLPYAAFLYFCFLKFKLTVSDTLPDSAKRPITFCFKFAVLLYAYCALQAGAHFLHQPFPAILFFCLSILYCLFFIWLIRMLKKQNGKIFALLRKENSQP